MPRGRKAEGGEQPKAQSKARQRAEARSNLTEETFLLHFNEYARLKRELDEKNGELRNALKRAKGEGVNEKMLKRVFQERKTEPDKVSLDERDLFRYRRWLRIPTGFQADMFSDLPGDEQDERPPVGDDKAYDDGFFAGCEARNLSDNPHEPDTAENQRWQAGWYDAQSRRAREMGDKAAA